MQPGPSHRPITAEPPAPPEDPTPGPAGRGGLFALLGTVQVTLIFTITLIGIPLPAIGAELGLDGSELVVTSAAYGLAFSGLLLFGGRLADRYGGRPVFVSGLVIFAAASAIAPAAVGFGTLATSRFCAGIGAALVAPAAMVLLRALFPEPAEYSRAMATWGGLSVLGGIAGIVLSGAVAAVVSWRWMFTVPVLVAGLALLLARRLPSTGRPCRRVGLDTAGAVLATCGLTLLSVGLVMSGNHAWSSVLVGAPIGCGLALLVAFGAVQARGRDPLLPPAFLTDRRRAAALVIIGLSAAATAAVCLFLALYLQQVRGWSPAATSMAFVPYALALIATGRVAGRLVERLGAASTVVAGLAVTACGLFLLARLDPHAPYVTGLLPGLLALPVGIALTLAAATVLAVADVPAPRMGLAAGTMNTALELGPTVGLALLSALASARTRHAAATSGRPGATTDGYAWAFGASGLAVALVAVLVIAGRAAGRAQR